VFRAPAFQERPLTKRTMKVLLLATRAATLVVILASCESNLGPTPADAEVRWRPAPGLSWQWQLSGRVDISFRVDVYDVDGVETPAATMDELHAGGAKVVCYVSAGSWERWRPDAGVFSHR